MSESEESVRVLVDNDSLLSWKVTPCPHKYVEVVKGDIACQCKNTLLFFFLF